MYYKYMGKLQADMPSEEEMIELLIFNKEDIENNKIDFRWIHSREFKYNGDMYDIVKKKETDKQLIVYVINDTKEKKLEEEFEKRVHKNSSEDKQRSATNNNNFVSIAEPVRSVQIEIAIAHESVLNNLRANSYNSLHLDIPSPPPRLV
jgi:septum formation inhibitor MinC